MATVAKALGRGTLSDSSATLYTVPAATTAVVTNIVLSNSSSAAATVTMSLDGVGLLTGVEIGANSVVAIDLRQVLSAADLIAGESDTDAVIDYHISGVEIA